MRVIAMRMGLTPVTASIILIGGTIVLALVVGAYTFGLFGNPATTSTNQPIESNNGLPFNFTGIDQGYLTAASYQSTSNETVLTLSDGTPCGGHFQIAEAGNATIQLVKLGDLISVSYLVYYQSIPLSFSTGCHYNVTSWRDISR